MRRRWKTLNEVAAKGGEIGVACATRDAVVGVMKNEAVHATTAAAAAASQHPLMDALDAWINKKEEVVSAKRDNGSLTSIVASPSPVAKLSELVDSLDTHISTVSAASQTSPHIKR